MKCENCGGVLNGSMTICPYCQARQDIDLKKIHFRDRGFDPLLLCPECTQPLNVIEIATEPAVNIERCGTCSGLFFNPGELEYLLDEQTNPVIWLDPVDLHRIIEEFEERKKPVAYRKCPVCSEIMTHLNFGSRSGVILDHCGQHGLWLDGGEFRRLSEWWRSGGKHLHQVSEANRVKYLYRPKNPPPARPSSPGTVESGPWTDNPPTTPVEWVVGGVILGIMSLFD